MDTVWNPLSAESAVLNCGISILSIFNVPPVGVPLVSILVYDIGYDVNVNVDDNDRSCVDDICVGVSLEDVLALRDGMAQESLMGMNDAE